MKSAVIIILNHYLTIIEFIHELCVISDLTYIITHKSCYMLVLNAQERSDTDKGNC